MVNLDKMAWQLESEEGRYYKVYRCPAGKLTIGIGRNLEDTGLTDDEIDLLVRNDIKRISAGLDVALPWWKALDEIRQRALIDLAFNLGIMGLLGFKKTLGFLQMRYYKSAAQELLTSNYAKQLPRRSKLIAGMIETGVDPYDKAVKG